MSEIDPYMKATVLQCKMAQTTGAALLLARLFRVHQDHKAGMRIERFDEPTEAH